jgi:hypothetical protein
VYELKISRDDASSIGIGEKLSHEIGNCFKYSGVRSIDMDKCRYYLKNTHPAFVHCIDAWDEIGGKWVAAVSE